MLNAYRHEVYLGIFLNIRSIILRIIDNLIYNCIGFDLNDFDVFRYKVLILLTAKYYTYHLLSFINNKHVYNTDNIFNYK